MQDMTIVERCTEKATEITAKTKNEGKIKEKWIAVVSAWQQTYAWFARLPEFYVVFACDSIGWLLSAQIVAIQIKTSRMCSCTLSIVCECMCCWHNRYHTELYYLLAIFSLALYPVILWHFFVWMLVACWLLLTLNLSVYHLNCIALFCIIFTYTAIEPTQEHRHDPR